MNRYHHSKSGLFLMELLINLLLFCVLCGCGLMFFMKSHNLANDATCLHQAVRITSSVAAIYETGDGSLTPLSEIYKAASSEQNGLTIYFDSGFRTCNKDGAVYRVTATPADTVPHKLSIDFYNEAGTIIYHLEACHHTPVTLGNIEEVTAP